MKLRIKSESKFELACWAVVKTFVLVVVLSLVVDPVTRSWSKSTESNLKTVLPAQIKALKGSSISLGFPAGVVKVYVTPGTKVVAGQILAELESREITEAVAMAKMRLEVAEQGASQTLSAAQRKLFNEQMDAASKHRDSSHARLKNYTVDAAEQTLAQAHKDAQRIGQLVQQQLATGAELENARKQEALEQRNLLATKENWLRLKQEADAADGQIRMLKVQTESSPAGPDRAAAQLNRQEAEIALRQALERQASLRVVAPQSGVVLQVNVEEGIMAAAWTPLFQIADLERLEVSVPISSRMAQAIKPGMVVNVVLPMEPPVRIGAKVSEVAFVANQNSQSHMVKILVRNPTGDTALAGQEGTVEFPHGGVN